MDSFGGDGIGVTLFQRSKTGSLSKNIFEISLGLFGYYTYM